MRTDTLIAQLSSQVAPVPPRALDRRLLLGLAGGGVASLLLLALLVGLRADLRTAAVDPAFWTKVVYSLALCLAALPLVRELARPSARPGRLPWLAVVPVAALALLAGVELATAPVARWPALALGHSWTWCPWWVLMLALPIQAGFMWSFRCLAPTRLRAAGAAAGLAAGGLSAAIYCLVCTETAATFVLVWYSAGIALSTGLGALLGPRLLRW